MILYLVKDLKKQSYSHPIVAPDIQTVEDAFKKLNPENLSDLQIVVLTNFTKLADLEKLQISKSKKPLKKFKLKSPRLPVALLKKSLDPQTLNAVM